MCSLRVGWGLRRLRYRARSARAVAMIQSEPCQMPVPNRTFLFSGNSVVPRGNAKATADSVRLCRCSFTFESDGLKSVGTDQAAVVSIGAWDRRSVLTE
jgi:lipopolysaccharide export system protein LptA